METEFYPERLRDRTDFLQKEIQCPWNLVQQKLPDAPLSLLYLPPVLLEDLLDQRLHPNSGVRDVWGHPCSGFRIWIS